MVYLLPIVVQDCNVFSQVQKILLLEILGQIKVNCLARGLEEQKTLQRCFLSQKRQRH